jgi:site-specific recombinase XerD
MNSFREYRGRWRWFVLGKGGKKAKVPVNGEMLAALVRYRRFLQLEDLPQEDEDGALLRSLKGTKGISANMIYRVVKATVAHAADSLEDTSVHKAAELRKASTHCFRHTALTHGDDAGIGMKYLYRSARHGKLETTAIYQHAEDDPWHEEWQRHRY